MNPFRSLREYEVFIYTLQHQFPLILGSTLTVIQRSSRFAELSGEITFPEGLRLAIYERLSWDAGPLTIEGYSYEGWKDSRKQYWYDSQPHPDDPILASTNPHHKHVPPNIKHNGIPAPGLSLIKPNISFLIQEIESILLQTGSVSEI